MQPCSRDSPRCDPERSRAAPVAGAGQIVAHVVQLESGCRYRSDRCCRGRRAELRTEADARDIIIAVTVCGGYLEEQIIVGSGASEADFRGLGAGQGDVGALELPPAPGTDADATACGHRERGPGAVLHYQKRRAAGNQTRLTGQQGAAGDAGGKLTADEEGCRCRRSRRILMPGSGWWCRNPRHPRCCCCRPHSRMCPALSCGQCPPVPRRGLSCRASPSTSPVVGPKP